MSIQVSLDEFQKKSAGKTVKQSISLCLLSDKTRYNLLSLFLSRLDVLKDLIDDCFRDAVKHEVRFPSYGYAAEFLREINDASYIFIDDDSVDTVFCQTGRWFVGGYHE